MGAIQLYSADNRPYRINVRARTRDGTQEVEAIVISTEGDADVALGSAEFKVAFDLPAEFVTDGRLKNWSDIQSDIKGLRVTGNAKKAETQEAARDLLRNTLANCSINVAPNAGGFLGIDGVGFANAQASARLVTNLVLLDQNLTPKPEDDAPVLTVGLSASGQAQVAGNTCQAAMRLDIVITRGGLINAIPSLSIDPPADFKIPTSDFRLSMAKNRLVLPHLADARPFAAGVTVSFRPAYLLCHALPNLILYALFKLYFKIAICKTQLLPQ